MSKRTLKAAIEVKTIPKRNSGMRAPFDRAPRPYYPRPSSLGIRKRGRPVTTQDGYYIETAADDLKSARFLLGEAGARHALARVRAALKSAQGALNNARRMLARQERAK